MFDSIVQEMERCGLCVCPQFIALSDLAHINHFIDERKSEFQAAKVGPIPNKQRLVDIRGDFTYWIDPLSPPDALKPCFNLLDSLKDLFNQKLYLGIKDFETHLALYPVGTYYKKHLDRFETDSSRVLSFVFYLNETWNEGDEGELVLYNKSNLEIQRITPAPGTFVCFLSNDFPHEVRIPRKERRSLTGWMHTKILN